MVVVGGDVVFAVVVGVCVVVVVAVVVVTCVVVFGAAVVVFGVIVETCVVVVCAAVVVETCVVIVGADVGVVGFVVGAWVVVVGTAVLVYGAAVVLSELSEVTSVNNNAVSLWLISRTVRVFLNRFCANTKSSEFNMKENSAIIKSIEESDSFSVFSYVVSQYSSCLKKQE